MKKSRSYARILYNSPEENMIGTQEVKHVARLARLELTEEEVNKYSKQLGEILQYVEQMNEIDTTGIEPMPHAIPVYNVMREDIVKYEETKEELMQNAPFEENGFFRVPKIN